jgi:signal transduction histidine kinase/ActR/RegA family two-component response regulator
MTPNPTEPARPADPLRASVPFLVLAVCLLVTAGAVYFIGRTVRVQERFRFDNAARHARNTISARIEAYLALLRAEAGLFAASEDVTRDDFGEFASRLELRRRYPGGQGVGYSVRVLPPDVPRLVAAMRAQGIRGFHIWPDYPRPEYHAIVYLEPLDRRNSAAIGYDMFTEPIRRAAMEQAARTGMAAASGKVTLVQEIEGEKQPGFLIYLPVYARGAPLSTEPQRMAALQGVVYSPFRAWDLLSSLFPLEADRDVDVQVFDLHRGQPEMVLFDSQRGQTRHDAAFVSTERLEVAGRPWWLVVSSRPPLEQSPERTLAFWTIIGGLLLSLALFAVVRSEVRARAQAELASESLRHSQAAVHATAQALERMVIAERGAHVAATEANRAKDEFLATLSHELRTPLNAILGWATMLRTRQLPPDQQERALGVIERNARSQSELIDHLLDVSRIITGKLRLDLRAVELAPPIQAAVDAVRPVAEARDVELEWLPEASGTIVGDPERIQQIAWNLLSNAIKFTPAGGAVAATLRASADRAELTVRDTGIGIAPEFLPHVFERFRQADSSTTREHRGLGLGLAIVRYLVEAHGGSVTVDSKGQDCGSTFTVRLPLRTESGQPLLPAAAPEVGRPQRRLEGTRILIVDDEVDARELVATVLRAQGADATPASSADEALACLAAERFDVILADIGMPGQDGIEFIRRVRSLPPEQGGLLPALALTAYGRSEDRQRALDAGFQAHLMKPALPAEIVSAVAGLVTERA